ncbi:hypothetical protein Anas_03664 [Armadillidium nasatum]|uniref:4Fe-4S ferredoxin-type domain-containing protein n=1 Tax=Armadillidium nasatum TaxID=96803 RepID=A0A5N5TI32_9CRUS|nr:hypothetical protein Anas_03664 [Armadillidium nasatum]
MGQNLPITPTPSRTQMKLFSPYVYNKEIHIWGFNLRYYFYNFIPAILNIIIAIIINKIIVVNIVSNVSVIVTCMINSIINISGVSIEDDVDMRLSEDETPMEAEDGQTPTTTHHRPPSYNPEDYAHALTKYSRAPNLYVHDPKDKKFCKRIRSSTNREQQIALRRTLIDEFECLSCLRCCLRCADAAPRLANYRNGLYCLAAATMSSLTRSRTIALQLMTKACENSVAGHRQVVEAFSTLRLRFAEPVRCKFLVSMMLSYPHPSFQVWGLKLVNALLMSAVSLRERIYLQEELIEAGFDSAAIRKKLLEENVLVKAVGGEVEERCAALKRRLEKYGIPTAPSPTPSVTDSEVSSFVNTDRGTVKRNNSDSPNRTMEFSPTSTMDTTYTNCGPDGERSMSLEWKKVRPPPEGRALTRGSKLSRENMMPPVPKKRQLLDAARSLYVNNYCLNGTDTADKAVRDSVNEHQNIIKEQHRKMDPHSNPTKIDAPKTKDAMVDTSNNFNPGISSSNGETSQDHRSSAPQDNEHIYQTPVK